MDYTGSDSTSSTPGLKPGVSGLWLPDTLRPVQTALISPFAVVIWADGCVTIVWIHVFGAEAFPS